MTDATSPPDDSLSPAELRTLILELAAQMYRPFFEADASAYMLRRLESEASSAGSNAEYPGYTDDRLDPIYEFCLAKARRRILSGMTLDLSAAE